MAILRGSSSGTRGGAATLSRGGGFSGGKERSSGPSFSSESTPKFSSRVFASYKPESSRPALSMAATRFGAESNRGNKTGRFAEAPRAKAPRSERPSSESPKAAVRPAVQVNNLTGEVKMSKIPLVAGPVSISPMSRPDVARPTVNLTKTESRPTLSMASTRFAAENNRGNKTGRFAEAPRSIAPKVSLIKEAPRVQKAEVKAVIPQPTTFTRVDRLPSFMPKAETKPVVLPRTDTSVNRPGLPVVPAPRQVENKPIVQTRAEVRVTPVIVPDVPRSKPTEVVGPQRAEAVRVKTQERTNIFQVALPLDDEEAKRRKAQREAAQKVEAALALVRAGLAADTKAATVRVNESVQKDPNVLANPHATEQVTLQAIDRLTLQPKAEVAKPRLQTERVVQADADTTTATHAMAVAGVSVEATAQSGVRAAEQVKVEKNASIIMKQKLEEKMEKQKGGKDKGEIKVDDYVLGQRVQRLRDSVASIFPAWNLEFTAPLAYVAARIQRTSETDSGLKHQLNLNNDGTNNSKHDWITPLLNSEAIVNASQAMLAGMLEIYAKFRLPGVIKDQGEKLNDASLKTILSKDDSKDDYELAA